jgi:hypothetical protein
MSKRVTANPPAAAHMRKSTRLATLLQPKNPLASKIQPPPPPHEDAEMEVQQPRVKRKASGSAKNKRPAKRDRPKKVRVHTRTMTVRVYLILRAHWIESFVALCYHVGIRIEEQECWTRRRAR